MAGGADTANPGAEGGLGSSNRHQVRCLAWGTSWRTCSSGLRHLKRWSPSIPRPRCPGVAAWGKVGRALGNRTTGYPHVLCTNSGCPPSCGGCSIGSLGWGQYAAVGGSGAAGVLRQARSL